MTRHERRADNQSQKKMEHEMDSGVIQGLIRSGTLWPWLPDGFYHRLHFYKGTKTVNRKP